MKENYKPWTEAEKKVFDKTALKELQRAIQIAADRTVKIMGYNVIAEDGWIVKIFPDGSIERLHALETLYKVTYKNTEELFLKEVKKIKQA